MKKYLIIRFSSIGDIVLTTALIRCLKLQQPEAEVLASLTSAKEPQPAAQAEIVAAAPAKEEADKNILNSLVKGDSGEAK